MENIGRVRLDVEGSLVLLLGFNKEQVSIVPGFPPRTVREHIPPIIENFVPVWLDGEGSTILCLGLIEELVRDTVSAGDMRAIQEARRAQFD